MSTSLQKKNRSTEDSGHSKTKHVVLTHSLDSPDKVRDLRFKVDVLPLVHQTNKRIESSALELAASQNGREQWVVAGGPSGLKLSFLQFRCSALSDPPVDPPAEEYHMTYKTMQAETKLLSAILNAHGMKEAHASSNEFNLLWTGTHPKPHLLKSMTIHQRVNHFPRSFELTRKDRLYKNIEKMQHIKGVKHFDFVPQTFVMPVDFRDFCSTHYRQRGPWIVKPVASSRGRGIYIVDSPDQVPLEESLVVAKYIDNPLLVDGRKCDLRLYVVVTSYDPLLIYMYEEGLVRFAAVKYDSSGKHLWNPCMHLCNYSINKYHSDYIKSDDPDAEDVGHKWTLSALLRHLKSEGMDTMVLMDRIEEVVVKAILASSPPIISACKMFVPFSRNCFELYGFDILVDSALKPWLLEVNLSPSLGCDSPLDVRVKSAMLVDLLTLVGIPAVDPMVKKDTARRPDILKKLSYRRAQSADALPGSSLKKVPPTAGPSRFALTSEETRIVKMARAEFDRRGGFVRIFPSPESWRRYSIFLDSSTGITCTSILGGGGHPALSTTSNHNYNLLLHQQLFPELQVLGKMEKCRITVSCDRLNRYERTLLKGYRASLHDKQAHFSGGSKSEGSKSISVSTSLDIGEEDMVNVKELKQAILDSIHEGNRLTQYQARRMFSQYLNCILRRVSSRGSRDELCMDDCSCELILRFLQRASTNLRAPYFVQIPSRNLTGKDRIAFVAKQLNDFIYLYNRETELYSEDGNTSRTISNSVFQRFLNCAKESDLEDVLSTQTRLYKCAHLYLGRCGPGTRSQQPLGLLRTLPCVRDRLGSSGSYRCGSESMSHTVPVRDTKVRSLPPSRRAHQSSLDIDKRHKAAQAV